MATTELPEGGGAALRASDLLDRLRAGDGAARSAAVLPTGFDPLDDVLEGGFRVHDLVLVGGRPGVGKTIVTLQWARNIALRGARAVYVCYEHDEATLFSRLLALELAETAPSDYTRQLGETRQRIRKLAAGALSPAEALREDLLLRAAAERIGAYGDRLELLRGSGARTGLAELAELLEAHKDEDVALFVDYLQKVPVGRDGLPESERVTHIAEGLKDLALSHSAAVVAVAAADGEGLRTRRMRTRHLRGSTSLAYESDIIVLLNAKEQAVSKVHFAFDTVKAEAFRDYVTFSLEKNRSGQALIDMEFRKDFPHFRFDPDGAFVAERLLDEERFVEE